jgi:heme A synthase
MTLSEFKYIFYWEYAHRMFGRVIGVAFAVPFAYFAARRRLPPPLLKLLLGVGGLFAFQACSVLSVHRVCSLTSMRRAAWAGTW